MAPTLLEDCTWCHLTVEETVLMWLSVIKDFLLCKKRHGTQGQCHAGRGGSSMEASPTSDFGVEVLGFRV